MSFASLFVFYIVFQRIYTMLENVMFFISFYNIEKIIIKINSRSVGAVFTPFFYLTLHRPSFFLIIPDPTASPNSLVKF